MLAVRRTVLLYDALLWLVGRYTHSLLSLESDTIEHGKAANTSSSISKKVIALAL